MLVWEGGNSEIFFEFSSRNLGKMKPILTFICSFQKNMCAINCRLGVQKFDYIISFKGVGWFNHQLACGRMRTFFTPFGGELELHASQNQLLDPPPQKRGLMVWLCIASKVCVFVGSPNHHQWLWVFLFFFESGFAFFFCWFVFFCSPFFVCCSKEKVKEKPGKDEKKSKVRPVFWVGEGGGLVWVHERSSEISKKNWRWNSSNFFSRLSISVQTLHQLVRLVLMIRYTPKVYFFPDAYFQIPCHNKSSVFQYSLKTLDLLSFSWVFFNVTHLTFRLRCAVPPEHSLTDMWPTYPLVN